MALLALLAAASLASAQVIRREERERRREDRERGSAPAPSPAPSPRASPSPAPSGPIRRRETPPPGPAPSVPQARPSAPIVPRAAVRPGRPPDLRDARDRSFLQGQERARIVRGTTTRHHWRGSPYWHHFDGRRHWWGWRRHDRFYWAYPFGGYWWWWDPVALHWSFWWGGYWWWPGPHGALYIQVDDVYRPYDAVAAGAPPPAPAAAGSYKSPDGRRTVQVAGAASEAFLYDSSGPAPVFMRFLARGVERVRFSGGADGAGATILLDLKDGAFAHFDADGRRLEGAAAPAESIPGPPPSIPSPPPEKPSALPPPAAE